MPPRVFSTVSDPLLEYAEAIAVHFENNGYTVYSEKPELAFPYTPTLICKRQSTTVVVELSNRILIERINAWVSYARSCNSDTRIAICLTLGHVLTSEDESVLREKGVGMYAITQSAVFERIPPKDLALNMELPKLDAYPIRLRRLLGSAYEQFNRSQWREGFEDACQAFEVKARQYLSVGIKSGRITLVNSKGAYSLTPKQVGKMTMGKLAGTFAQIQNQNYLDSQIGKVLASVNKDRVGVAHHKTKVTTEKRLRANVGQHMWTIVNVMKKMM